MAHNGYSVDVNECVKEKRDRSYPDFSRLKKKFSYISLSNRTKGTIEYKQVH